VTGTDPSTPDRPDDDVVADAGVIEPDGPDDEDAAADAGAIELDDADVAAALESVLLVVDTPASEEALASAIGRGVAETRDHLQAIAERLTATHSGIDLRESGGGWRCYTRDVFAPVVERFVMDGTQTRLSKAALETLAVVAYRAYQQVAGLFVELQAAALRRYPRAVTLEERYLNLLPEVHLGMDAAAFAAMAREVFAPKPPPPEVSVAHVHSSPESVAEHTRAVVALLKSAGTASFTELVAECTSALQVIARFRGLLNLYRNKAVAFDQDEPMGPLTVRWTGEAEDDGGTWLTPADDASDEEDR
jgi:hypothetical protein